MNQSKEMVKIAVHALEEKKGEDIKIIDINGVSVIADYFVLASATNSSQLQALVDSVEEELFKAGFECRQKEKAADSAKKRTLHGKCNNPHWRVSGIIHHWKAK